MFWSKTTGQVAIMKFGPTNTEAKLDYLYGKIYKASD